MKKKKKKHLFRTLTEADEVHRAMLTETERLQYVNQQLQMKVAEKPLPFVWTTADGDRLLPSQMDEGHLRNTISFLQRMLVHSFGTARYLNKTEARVLALYEMLKEARVRGIEV